MEELQKEFEDLKMKEQQKQADLAQAQVDLKASTAAVQELTGKVHELHSCRSAEMALVENLFSSGEVNDAQEKQLQAQYGALGPQIQQVYLKI